MKPDKTPRIISTEFEYLIRKVDTCVNNLEKFLTTKIGELIPCGCLMSVIYASNNIENKHSLYRGENCMENLCISLRKHAASIITF